MRILLILIIIAAVFVVVQAQRHGCKYDATLISCVFGSSEEQPAAEAPADAEMPASEAPAEAPAQ
jgi:hypothetical protein